MAPRNSIKRFRVIMSDVFIRVGVACLADRPMLKHQMACTELVEKRARHIRAPRMLQNAARTKLPRDAFETGDIENTRTADKRTGQTQ